MKAPAFLVGSVSVVTTATARDFAAAGKRELTILRSRTHGC